MDESHTSHAAYLRERKVPWLDLRMATALMAQRGDPRRVYLDLMAQPPTPVEIQLFTLGNRGDARIIGDADFKSTLPYAVREVAQRLRRHPSSLSTAIERHRGERPDLFVLNALHHLIPLA